jgi:hypothetical protein
MTKRKLVIGGVIVAAVALLVLGAQQTLQVPLRLEAVPFELTARAVVRGIPNARYFVLSDVESLVRDALAARQREKVLGAKFLEGSMTLAFKEMQILDDMLKNTK